MFVALLTYMLRKVIPKRVLYTRMLSVFAFQIGVNSVSGLANCGFYSFTFDKFHFLPFQIFKIPFHFYKPYFWCQ